MPNIVNEADIIDNNGTRWSVNMQFQKRNWKWFIPALLLIDLITIDIVESSQCIFGDMLLVYNLL